MFQMDQNKNQLNDFNWKTWLISLKLQQMLVLQQKYNKPIIYTNEIYIHSSHTVSVNWHHQSLLGRLFALLPKGLRLVITHVKEVRMIFMPSALLIIKVNQVMGGYNNDMNCKQWVTEKTYSEFGQALYHNVVQLHSLQCLLRM